LTGDAIAADQHVERCVKGTHMDPNVDAHRVLGAAFVLRSSDDGCASVNWLEVLNDTRATQIASVAQTWKKDRAVTATARAAILQVAPTIAYVATQCNSVVRVIELPTNHDDGTHNHSHAAIVGYAEADLLVPDALAEAVMELWTVHPAARIVQLR
jgi:hypothetical protein